MARIGTGSITLFDVTDGTNPITHNLTNENHTFVASENGVVESATRAGFTSSLNVWVGSTKATYNTTTTTHNTFRITGVSYVGTATGWGNLTISAAGAMSLPSLAQNPTEAVTARVTFSVTNDLGSVTTGLTRDITMNVVKQGAGGASISLNPTRQHFFGNFEGTLDGGQDNIEITIVTAGSTGALTVHTSLDGGAFNQIATAGSTAGGVSGFDTDTSGAFTTTGAIPSGVARLSISQANMGSANELSVRVEGATAGADTVTVTKVRRGQTGEHAIFVDVTSSDDDVFKNGAGADKTLTAIAYDQGTGSSVTSGVSYNWTRSGSGSVSSGAVRVTSSSNRAVIASGGVEANGTAFNTVIVGADDVFGKEKFSCRVTVSD